MRGGGGGQITVGRGWTTGQITGSGGFQLGSQLTFWRRTASRKTGMWVAGNRVMRG